MTRRQSLNNSLAVVCLLACLPGVALAQGRQRPPMPPFPPALANGASHVVAEGEELLARPATLLEGVEVATAAPRVEFLYYPGQDYPGNIWSCWGEGLAAGGKYYSAIGDHLAPQGTARVFEYDPERRSFRQLLDIKTLLGLPEGHYVPGKIHSRIDLAADGWLYLSTHRGSQRVTNDAYHYQGDWILRCRPGAGLAEVVQRAPVAKHCIPASVVDPQRMIFYGATAAGEGDEGPQFFAYDLQGRKLIYSGPNGPTRAMILSRRTGRVYFVPGAAGADDGPLMRFDPAEPGPPRDTGLRAGVRAATQETAEGLVYLASHAPRGEDSQLAVFDTAAETITPLGPLAVGGQQYVASLAVDPQGKHIYYVPGAHGGSDQDGSPLVRFDPATKTRRVVAFLEPYFTQRHQLTLKGTYSVAVGDQGDNVFITWNVSRGTRSWDCCGLTVVRLAE